MELTGQSDSRQGGRSCSCKVVGINCHLLNAFLDSRSYQLRLSKKILAMISFSTHRSFPCLGKLTISSNCKKKWINEGTHRVLFIAVLP